MNRVLVELTMIATILGTATAAGAQTALASDESPFRFQLQQSESPRGLAVEGYVYNALPSRITNAVPTNEELMFARHTLARTRP